MNGFRKWLDCIQTRRGIRPLLLLFVVCCINVLLLASAIPIYAMVALDGPEDNQTDRVRPIPPPGIEISREDAERWLARAAKLDQEINAWREQSPDVSKEIWPDIAVFPRAVRMAVAGNQFYSEADFGRADQLLEIAEQRLKAAQENQTPWLEKPGVVFRGFVSELDGTVQPYAVEVNLAAVQGQEAQPMDVWFHGRGERMAELQFLSQKAEQLGVFHSSDTVTVFPYGRYCNANKFAGEVDTLEAMAAVQRRWKIDPDRIAVRGFSMGGASAWQFAVHYPGLWSVANPGAGFAETPDFLQTFQKETLTPYWWERKLWHWYDATDWAGNLSNCPTIAYSGEKDIQKQAADIMAKALAEEGIDLVHVIGPDTGHRYHPDSAIDVEQRVRELSKLGRDRVPASIGFTTYTLKYAECSWLKVTGLQSHWEKATVQAFWDNSQFSIAVNNVTSLELNFPAGSYPLRHAPQVQILFQNGGQWQMDTIGAQDIVEAGWRMKSDRSWRLPLRLEEGHWIADQPEAGLRKRPGLQGPVDDALMGSFLFVQPTGESPWSAAGQWSTSERIRAMEQWEKHFRGEVRIKKDIDITDEDRACHHLILWGDPISNREWARLADRLPVKLMDEHWQLGDRQYSASDHAPIFIYPNPDSPDRYVVANSSFTFREFAYLNNARQVPMLPDWAMVDLRVPAGYQWPGGIAAADFFDEQWKVKLPIPDPIKVDAPAPVQLPGR